MKEKLAAIILCLASALNLCACEKVKEGNIEIITFDIGKADCSVIISENSVVMIDTGEDDDGTQISQYLRKEKIHRIDYLIITHFDKDHVGGAAAVIENFEIGEIIVPDYKKKSDEYQAYKDAIKEKDIVPIKLTEVLNFSLDSVEYTVYPPEKQDYKKNESNNFSLITSVKYNETSYLFMGDANEERIEEFLGYENLRHDYIKVSHHGAYMECLPELFDAVSPEYAVITCSDKNPENGDTMKALKNAGASVYLTKNGNVHLNSDGKEIKIKVKR